MDRTEVEVGDEVILTVTVEAPGGMQVELVRDPALAGLTLLGTSRGTDFRAEGDAGTRATTWRYQLRAIGAGTASVGSIRVRVGDSEFRTDRIDIAVRSVNPQVGQAMQARLQRIVNMAPGPDGSDDVIVTVVPSPDTLVLGEQLDLVVVAWFPRDVRTRLRTRPTLTPPDVRGAWTYSQTSALGVTATREMAGRSYDLFVHHQVVFPLTSGPFTVGPATVSYNLPLRMSILSREVPQEVQSTSFDVHVVNQPTQGRPPNFGGSAASRLQLQMDVDTGGFATGTGGSLSLILSGRGNVSLWPEPQVEWPRGLRVYPGNTDVRIDSDGGLVGGAKTFNYLLVADSVGSFAIPNATFEYFDTGGGRYRRATTEPITLVARVGMGFGSEESEVAPLVRASREPWAVTALAWLTPWGIWVLVGLPPLLAAGIGLGRLVRRFKRLRSDAREKLDGLAAAHDSFKEALERLVPESRLRDGEGLAAALRASGVEAPVAQHATRVRERLRHAVYGPNDPGDFDELIAEVQAVLRALPLDEPRHGRVAVAILAVLVVASPVLSVAQSPPEQLYDAGIYRAAADSFAHRATAEPSDAAHWINLGHAWFAAREPIRARSAWTRAARLKPRDDDVQSALQQVSPLDPESRRLTFVFPIAPAEALMGAVVFWIVGWVVVISRRRKGVAVACLVAGLLCGAYGGYVQWRYGEHVGLILLPDTPIRVAPYGSAASSRSLSEDAAVRIVRFEGAWLLVRRGDATGWVLTSEVTTL